jgi:3-dehydroquinate synthase
MKEQMNKIIDVNVAHSYKITIEHNSSQIGEVLKNFIKSNAVIIHDSNIPLKSIEQIEQSFVQNGIEFSKITLEKTGEGIKTFEHFREISERLIEMNVNRKTTLVAIGGGTVGDFVGFVASTFMRGIPFIQVPTTLLSMVDSSVGGKVAINLGHYKNCIGAFCQPKHVFIDVSLLKTLPSVELVSGYAEVLKYGFIADYEFYKYLLENAGIFTAFLENRNFTDEALEYLMQIIGKSCEIKASVVSQDETETKGIRDVLNFGHTFGHAFEGIFMGKLPHGIAVGIGMICALKYSKISVDTILKHYEQIGLLFDIKQFCEQNNKKNPTVESIVELMLKDKKNEKGSIKLILLEEIGKAFVREEKAENISAFLSQI